MIKQILKKAKQADNNALPLSLLQKISTDAKVLDVGAGGFCGTVTTRTLLSRFKQQNITLIEKDDNFFNGLRRFETCIKIHADFFTYQFKNKFDLIVVDLDSSIEICEFQKIMSKCNDLLNPGGYMIYYTIEHIAQIGMLSIGAELAKQHIQTFYGANSIVTADRLKTYFANHNDFEFITNAERNGLLQWVLVRKKRGEGMSYGHKFWSGNEAQTVVFDPNAKVTNGIEGKPILTVALPCYNAGNIAWLAMEGLCNQKDIDFEWELVISEEKIPNAFGHDRFMEYEPRLKKVGCIGIWINESEKKVSLPEKWQRLGVNTSKRSIGFVLQAADCYSYPTRLKMSYDAMMEGYDWCQCKHGYFYELPTGKMILYQGETVKWGLTHLNMCLRTEYTRLLPFDNRPNGVDGWLFGIMKELTNGCPKIYNDESDNWKYGVDTDGENNISVKRKHHFAKPIPPFEVTKAKIEDCLPSEIIVELLKMKTC